MSLFRVILACFLCQAVAISQDLPAPTHLRCDFLLHPDRVNLHGLKTKIELSEALQSNTKYEFAKIFSTRPHLSWLVDTSIKKVTAYRILVASTPRILQQNKGDRWDSGKIYSSHLNANYSGKTLHQGMVYYWKVQVWNERGNSSFFSMPQSFTIDTPDSLNSFSHYPLSGESQSPLSIIQRPDGVYFIDFGKAALGQLSLSISSEYDDTLYVEVGESLEKEGIIHTNPGQNIRYLKVPLTIIKGVKEYTIQWPINEKRNARSPILMPDYIGEVYPFRYVTIANYKGALSRSDIWRKMIHYPFDPQSSSFVSSDTVLNQVWDLCKYSMKATSFTGYYVDGDRERIPYEADALINQLSQYAVDAEYSMARRTMEYLLFHPTWPTEWSLQNVLMAWNDYLYTGDSGFIKKYYYELKKKMLLPLAGSTGLISTRTNNQTDEFLHSIHITKEFDRRRGLTDIVDWPQNGNFIGDEKEYKGETDGFVFNQYNAVVNAFYYRNLVLMQKIAGALNLHTEAALFAAKSKHVYAAYRKIFRNPINGLIKDGDSTDHVSLHSNMFALAFGLIPAKDQDSVAKFIQSRRMACSVYGSQFLLDGLYEAGLEDYALELMSAQTQRSWYNMIRVGSTISLEAWDKDYKPNLDWNHAWGSAPANVIVRHLVGLQPLTPGYETLRIKPQLGHLTYVEMTTTTIRGEVAFRYLKEPHRDLMQVTIPGGTFADIYVPCMTSGKKLFKNGLAVDIKIKDGYFIASHQQAGEYVFELK